MFSQFLPVTTLTLMISRNLTKSASVSLAFQALFAVVSLLFYWAIGCKLCAIRRSTSNKDLRELQRELKTQEKLAEKSHMEWHHPWCSLSFSLCSLCAVDIYFVIVIHRLETLTHINKWVHSDLTAILFFRRAFIIIFAIQWQTS